MLQIVAVDVALFTIFSGSLGAVVSSAHAAMIAIKWIGGAVLLYMGVRLLFGRVSEGEMDSTRPSTRAPALTQLTNPKAYIFFATVVPSFINRAEPTLIQLTILLATFVATELCAFSAIAVGAGQVRRFLSHDRHMLWIARSSGGLIISAAVFLLAGR